ncbi:MAG: hypothetical protein D3922_00515 [Candidatus Electrothrix sp. AR1]|nr:hypothetical protein [Candidatus Electrothrix sp. AR1]
MRNRVLQQVAGMLIKTVFRRGYHTVRLLISGLFLYAGGSKLFSLPSFALIISDYEGREKSLLPPKRISRNQYP